MFNTDVRNLWSEISNAEKARDDIALSTWQKLIEQLSGQGSAWDPGKSDWPEQYAFEYISLMVPKIVNSNPRATVRSRRRVADSTLQRLTQRYEELAMMAAMEMGEPIKVVAELEMIYEELTLAKNTNNQAAALGHGLNRWIRDENYLVTLDRLCYDMLIGYGVSLSLLDVKQGHDPNDELSPRWPRSSRISPKRFVMDSQALHHTEARWKGHWSLVDKDDLIRSAKAGKKNGWRLDAVDALPTGVNPKENNHEDLNRNSVSVYELWVPDYTEDGWLGAEHGFHGGLFTLGASAQDDGGGETVTELIKDPHPYFGPPWGPYTIFGCYCKPDSPWPLSPLAATYTQNVELNAHARSMSKNAAEYKRLVFVSSDNTKLAQDIKSKPDMFVIPIESEYFNSDSIQTVEIAGLSQQQLAHHAYFKDRLERVGGLLEAQQGNLQPGITATAESIADSASQTRVSYIQSRFNSCVVEDLKSKAYYMDVDPRVEFELGPEAGESLGMIRPTWRGGPDETGKQTPFTDYEFEIDAYSMGRTNEALLQRNLMTAINMLFSAAPMMIEAPWMDWKQIVTKIGDALNLPDLVDIVKYDMIQQFAQQAMQSGIGQATQTSPQGLDEYAADMDQGAAEYEAQLRGAESGSANAF